MKYITLSLLFSILSITSIISQKVNIEEEKVFTCGYEADQQRYLSNEENALKQKQYEKEYQNYKNSRSEENKLLVVKTIPIVVHIIHSGDPLGSEDNPTDAQIATIISKASDRFRQMHPNAGSYNNPFYGIDPEIELCLSTVDPNGNYTSGILRYNDPVNTENPTPTYVNTIKWDVTKYANLILAKDISACGRYRGGVDYTEYQANCFWDGLICHEIGHQFSLGHTFSGNCTNGNCLADGDFVCDTPPKPASGTGGNACGSSSADSCTTDEDDTSTNNPYRSIANGGMGNQPDMLENYMDYTAGCWDAFTLGQKTRMHFNLSNNRSALTNHSAIACSGPSSTSNDIGIYGVNSNQSDDCQGDIYPDFNIYNYGNNTINTCEVNIYSDGALVSTQQFNNLNISPAQSINVTSTNAVSLSVGYDLPLEVEALLPNGVSDANPNNSSDYTSTNFIANSTCYNSCQSFDPTTWNGTSTILNVIDNFTSTTFNVDICYTVEGDLSLPTETFDVYDESNNLIGTTTPIADCSGQTPIACIQVNASIYNNWISDNQIDVTFTPTSNDINPTLCSTNEACVSIYVLDQNSSCPTSLNLTGTNTGDNSGPSNNNDNETSGIITSSQTIAATAVIDYDSASEINLIQGFQTLLGAIFEAFIDGCNNGGGGSNADKEVSTDQK